MASREVNKEKRNNTIKDSNYQVKGTKGLEDREKMDKIKFRKVEEVKIKKTGIEQLEQIKEKRKADKDISIQQLSENINKNITVFKANNSESKKTELNKSNKNRNNENRNNENRNNQSKDKTVTGKKSEVKNNSYKSDERKDDFRIRKSTSKTANTKKSVDDTIDKSQDNDYTYDYLFKEERKSDVTDISNTSKVRKQVKKRSDRKKRKEKREEKRKILKEKISKINVRKVVTVCVIVAVVISIGVAIFMTRIKTVEIQEGNNYTKEQVKDMVIKNIFDHNTVYLFLKYRYAEQENIPFVEYIDVSWVNRNTVEIKVYDKNIIACTSFMNEYLYFDKDGMVVETSNKKQSNIQYVTGLEFTEVKLNDKIKVPDEEIFDIILSVTQQISKYNLDIKEINFDEKNNLTLYSGDITILLGEKETYDEQLAKLKNMLVEANKKNLKGIMHMENYEEGQNRIIFNKID